MTKNLVMQALFRGVSATRPAKGLILHSDRGSQYGAHDYQKRLMGPYQGKMSAPQYGAVRDILFAGRYTTLKNNYRDTEAQESTQ